MLDIRKICNETEAVKLALAKRQKDYPIDELITLEYERKETITAVEELKARKNIVSSEIANLKKNKENADSTIKEMRELGDKIKELDVRLEEVKDSIATLLYAIPNTPHNDVPVGSSDTDNIEVRKFGEPTRHNTIAHWDIGDKLGLFNATEAAKITGARFTVYHGLGAKLERAIINLMLDTHATRGYEEVLTPYMVNRASMIGTGQLPKFEEDMFAIKNTDYYLIPTAEVPVTNLKRNDVLEETTLPIKYCSYSACFRAEAGSAGRDTKGLIRQHQFNKVELVKFAHPNNSFEELESLLKDAENILQILQLPYRVVTLCTGDLGFSSSKTYDIEVWMPSYDRYLEISSCSNFLDFQARRANIKYRDANGKLQFVHTLNGSGLAVGRTVAAVIENYYNEEDNSVTVPKALVKYIGVEKITL